MKLQNGVLRVSKNTSVLLIGSVGKMALSFAFIVYVARYLGAEGFGKYALTQGYFDLFLSLSAMGLSILITREIAKNPSWLGRYLTASIILVTVLTIVANAILVIIPSLFGYAADTRSAILIASLALLPAAVSMMFEAAFVAFETAEYVTYGTMLESFLRTGLSLLVLVMGYGLLSLFVVLIVARICTLLLYFALLKWRFSGFHWDFDWPFLKELVRNWRVFALENWLSNIDNSLGLILLSIFHGEVAVGMYAAAAKVMRLGQSVAASFTTAVFPYMSRLFVESRHAFWRLSEGSLKYMLAFVLPIVLIISILADRIIILLYTDEYAPAIPILQVLIFVLPLYFINPFLSHTLFARGEQKKSLQVAVIKLAFFAALCIWLIPNWEGIGLAWARLLGALVAFCLYFVFLLQGERALRTLLMLGRTVLAALILGGFLLALRNIQLIVLLISGGGLYVLLLLILRVFSTNDLELLQELK